MDDLVYGISKRKVTLVYASGVVADESTNSAKLPMWQLALSAAMAPTMRPA